MSFIEELKKSSTGRVQRDIAKNGYFHILVIRRMPFGYILLRSVIHRWEDIVEVKEEQTWDFRYLTELFATAKREGFFDEIAPNAPDWIGSDKFVLQPTKFSQKEEWEEGGDDLDDTPKLDKRDWYESSWGEDDWGDLDEDSSEDASDWDFSPPF